MTVSSPQQPQEAQSIEQALQRAVSHHQAGHLQDAEELYRTVLQAQPNHPDANHNMGVLAVQLGQPAGALPYFEAALQANPEKQHHWLSYIETLIQTGRVDPARQVLALGCKHGLQGEPVEALAAQLGVLAQDAVQKVAAQPDSVDAAAPIDRASGRQTNKTTTAKSDDASAKAGAGKAHGKVPAQAEINTLMALYGQARFGDVEILARSLTLRFPRHGFSWKVLGFALHCLGRPEEAEAAMQKAVLLSPQDVEAHNILGNVLLALKRLPAAEASYRRALKIKPGFADAHNNLGNLLRELGQAERAVASCRRAIEIKPDYAEAHCNLGNALRDMDKIDAALASYRRALELKPDFADAHNSLGAVLRDLGQFEGAEASCRRALAIRPDYFEAHCCLGILLMDVGQLDGALASCRRALEIKPDSFDAHNNLIFAQDLSPGLAISALMDERNRWDAIHAAPLAATHRPHLNARDPERRLRIGYVSADFRAHSAASVFGAMLVHFDRSRFEVFTYSNTRNEDALSEFFQQQVDCWRRIVGQSDAAVADLIRHDAIDILVDLSGHSAGNRLLVFARKPAPVQISAWGYATSTGMKTMDVFFADPVLVPPEEVSLFVEEIRYLPNVVSYFNRNAFPDINALPALTAPGITFGSFNRLGKVSEQAFSLWAQVLLAIPGSRLILKSAELKDPDTRDRVAGHFIRAGIDAERVTMLGKSSWHEHMATFNQVDIALDPFPHGGGVTTLEGLKMGIPVVTLRWPTIPGRLSASFLTTLGLCDWVAETPQQYVDIAIQKAQDLVALSALRNTLRGTLDASVIGDCAAYANIVEQEYRQLWRRWCARQEVQG